MLELEQVELSIIEVEERLERLSELDDQIKAARDRYDQLKSHYMAKIQRAEDILESETAEMCAERDSLIVGLRRYAERNITGKKRSLELPSGRLSFRKRQPLFFIGGSPVTNDNPKIITLAKNLDAELVKTKETADWSELKKRLDVDDDGKVYFRDTGEIVPNMWAKQLPDDFTIKTA